QEREDRSQDGGQRRLLRVVPAADDPAAAGRQAVAGNHGGGEGDAVQPQRQNGLADEASLLGGRRQDFRRALVLELAVRRLRISLVGLLRQQGNLARLLR